MTKQTIEQLAQEIMSFLEKNDIVNDTSIYFNNKVIRSGSNGWTTTEDVDPHDYFEYAAYDHILSMSYEGGLYEILNYTFGRKKEEFEAIFDKYGLRFEPGNSWNMTVYPCNDDMDIEYTKYKKPKRTIYLRREDWTTPNQLAIIMEMWYELSSKNDAGGSCVLGAGIYFEWNGDKYFMPAQSPYQGSLSWENHLDKVKDSLKKIDATEIYYDCGRLD